MRPFRAATHKKTKPHSAGNIKGLPYTAAQHLTWCERDFEMNTATHPRLTATQRQSAWTETLAKIVESARQRALALWSAKAAPATKNTSATAEANRVRNLAMDCMRHDPRFAADLFAAADRHEELHGR